MTRAAEGQGSDGQDAPVSALTERLERSLGQLSDGRRQLVEGILANLDETVFLSSHELGTRFGADPATVVRTVQALGYPSFAAFSRDLRSHFLSHVNPYRIMAREVTVHRGPAFHVEACLTRDLENVQIARQSLDPAVVAAVGRRLYRSRKIVVVAGDLEHSLARFFAYVLSGLGLMATAPEGEGLTLHRRRALGRHDALIAIGFRRCLRVPVESVLAARDAKAYTLAITDAMTTPLARFAEAALLVPIEGESFASSYAPTMVAINALAVACAHVNPRRTLKILEPTDQEYEVGLRWYPESETQRTRRKSAEPGKAAATRK